MNNFERLVVKKENLNENLLDLVNDTGDEISELGTLFNQIRIDEIRFDFPDAAKKNKKTEIIVKKMRETIKKLIKQATALG